MIKNSLFLLIWMMIMLPMLHAGNIIKQIWVPIVVSDITTFVPYTFSLPDKDNDGIDDATDRPVAYTQSLDITADSNGYRITLRGRDNDSPITYIIVTQPQHGTLAGTAPNLIYTPKNGYIGEDRFTFRVSDGVHLSSIVSINIVINASQFPVHSKAEASAFLSRATFGAKKEEIDALTSLNNYEQWIVQQLNTAPTYHMAWIESHLKGVDNTPDLSISLENWQAHSDTLGYVQRDAWWHIATYAPDQLRQRVALALSEILVISRNGPLQTFPDARVSYYDTLLKNAFGNFEDLLRDVTYHPAMGKYLSYLGNPKANPAKGSHPDENYAREVMQLFTIGLYQLNQDGTQKLYNGKPIPTYTQTDIKEMAKIFTGLSDDNGEFEAEAAFSSHKSRTKPMQAFEEEHDSGSKTVLGHTIHVGNTKGDINAALHMLFMHENTAPFISKQLIQRLVTSNPTPAYVARVAAVFNNNGKGTRGDLAAVVKAILLDKEALRDKNHPASFGKLREPLLYFTHLFRAFHAKGNTTQTIQVDNGPIYQYESFNFHGTDMTQQEGALEALTVFNYFSPTDGSASLSKQGLFAPELTLYGKQGIDDVLMGIINKNGFIYDTYNLTINLDLHKDIAFVQANNIEGLLDHLSLLLTANAMSAQSKNKIVSYLKNAKDDDGNSLDAETIARYALALVMTSPAYALQR